MIFTYTYKYDVTNLLRNAQDVIVAADFTITVSDGEASNKHSFHTAFNNRPDTPIPFEEITEDKVIEWIKRDVGYSSEEQALAELRALKKRQEIKSGTPWVANQE